MGECALSIGANTFQFFTRNPRGRSNGKTPSREDVAELCKILKSNGMHAPLAHAPYTYNPASKDAAIREYSATAMSEELNILEDIEGAMYNFHPGCHVGQGVEVGIDYIAEMLNRVLWEDMSTKVLLETMAGKGTELGRNFEEMRKIIDKVSPSLRGHIGVCLDTCHIHDGGYDIINNLDGVVEEFDRTVGIGYLSAIHLNNSMNPCASRKDRHARLAEGYIPISVISDIINHEKLRTLPFYLETPCDLEGYAEEIKMLKEMRK